MRSIRRLTITRSEHRTWRLAAAPLEASCPVCGQIVETLSTGEAACALEVEPTTLDLLIAQRKVHAIPMQGGAIRICKGSLFV